ncbi:MAG: ECF transporter S component [Bacillota bacterium]
MTARYVARTGVLLALALVVQMAGLPQPFTGPAVNAVLLLAAMAAGPVGAVLIGLLTPWIAFSRGILPPPLGPAIPFIMAGNAAIVLVYWAVTRLTRSSTLGWGSWLALALAATVKYLVISGGVNLLLELPPKLVAALGTPQLMTALTGGVTALLVATALEAAGLSSNGAVGKPIRR